MDSDLLQSLQKLFDFRGSCIIILIAQTSLHKEPDSVSEEEINLTSP
jgi:hypothetical protein